MGLVEERDGSGIVDELTLDIAVLGDEATEGLRSFMEKRLPWWVADLG